jgi:hypothetical protein
VPSEQVDEDIELVGREASGAGWMLDPCVRGKPGRRFQPRVVSARAIIQSAPLRSLAHSII